MFVYFMATVSISDQSDLETFLNSSNVNGVLTTTVNVNMPFSLIPSNGEKFLTPIGECLITNGVEINTLANHTGVLYSLNNILDGGFTVGNVNFTKDMYTDNYTEEYDPSDYPEYFPNMAPFVDSNIQQGDKLENARLTACCWDDWGNDVFDDWGYFYLYDVESGKYYFPLFSPMNTANGILTTQTFSVFGSIFTITHGYPVQGIFKFAISVNNSKPFKFGMYGNMGSDGDEIISHLRHLYVKGDTTIPLHYVKQQEDGDSVELVYTYFVPRKVSQNGLRTYNLYQESGNDENSLMSKEVTNGLTVYFSKTNDVKNWVVNDLEMTP